MHRAEGIRIVWLLPVAWFYWQPALSELARLFPQTTVFTGRFPGFARGLEGTLNVELVGEMRVVKLTDSEASYGDNFTYLSPRIISSLWQVRPHIIFTSSFGVWTLLALLLKPLLRCRVVIAYEGSSPGVDYLHSPLRLLLRRLMVAMADAGLSNSKAGATYLTEVLKAPKNRVFVQPYEIPDEHTLPGSDGDRCPELQVTQRPVFLFVGHVISRKGIALLLQACVLLKERGYNAFQLMVVGDGPEQADLEQFCCDRGLNDQVQWVGRIPFNQIAAYFKAADVFVLPTFEDTWGVVTLEAMLMGKAILCSQGAGTAELVFPGENGYVFPPDDPLQLADLMQTFLDHPEAIAAMGQRSQQIMAQYTPAAAAQCMAKITELVLAN